MLTKTTLAQSTPEAQGIASSAILAFINGVEQADLELHSFILVRHGQAVAKGWWSPYAAELPHMLFSLSKSFTSTAVGMAVAEGLLTIQDRVVDFFPDDLPAEVSDHLSAMTVYNLLTMNTGHDQDSTPFLQSAFDGNWAAAFLARPVEHKPGTYFVYNSGATYMLSAIVQKLTGQTLLEYLTPRLFEPLGIEGATWQSCPRGINVGGWGLKIKTDDIANFGQLYLQQGQWQGKQLTEREWVAAATSKQVPNSGENIDWAQGYGYQFWRCRYGAYRGDGAFGQFCIVMPEQDVVLAITSGVRNMQAVLNQVWEHLLPAMQDSPLAANSQAQAALADRLAGLSLRVQEGTQSSPTAPRVSGKRYDFDENEEGVRSLQLDFYQEGAELTLHDARGEHHIACGYQSWAASKTHLDQFFHESKPHSVAASGAWTAEDTYTVRLSFNETPFVPTLTFHFVGEQLEYQKYLNVSFGGPTALARPVLVGKLA
jgi:CubicO group peptidase (beta-lactamase class C family)